MLFAVTFTGYGVKNFIYPSCIVKIGGLSKILLTFEIKILIFKH